MDFFPIKFTGTGIGAMFALVVGLALNIVLQVIVAFAIAYGATKGVHYAR